MQRWSLVADSRRWFKKFFQTVFDVPLTHEVFLFLKVLVLKERKMHYSSVTIGSFFFSNIYHICDQFSWTCPQKNICIANWFLLLKKRLKVQAERRRSHWRQKRVVFQKTFWTSPRKTGNFEGIENFLCLVNQISRKSFPIN